MKTSLGKNENKILMEFDSLVKKWSNKIHKYCNDQTREEIESSVAYLWEDRKRSSEESVRDFLSANEIGPFGGR